MSTPSHTFGTNQPHDSRLGQVSEAEQRESSAPVLSVLEGFVPTRVSSSRFAAAEALVRRAVADCSPATPARARDMIRYASYLAGWCDSQGLPLRRDVVFDPEVVEDFIFDLRDGMRSESSATVASVLRSMAATIGPQDAGPVERRRHPGRRLRPPYDANDVAILFELAAISHSAKRRHDLTALLVLGLGAGATGQEAANARPEDVAFYDAGVTVTLRRKRRDGSWRRRSVVVLPDFQPALASLAQTTAEYLLGGGLTRHSRVYDLCDHSRHGRWPIRLEPARLRATYLVEIAGQPNTVLELLDRGGVESFEVFHELLGHLRSQGA